MQNDCQNTPNLITKYQFQKEANRHTYRCTR